MRSERLIKALNEQIKLEFESSYAYIAMEAHFKKNNLDGFANFFHIQAMEERDHAYLMFNYIYSIGGEVELLDISKPNNIFKDEIDVFEQTLAHEQKVTASINNLMDIAMEDKDYSAQAFLQWFIKEQDEEEEVATDLLEKVKMIKSNPSGLFMLDAKLAQRIYTPAIME